MANTNFTEIPNGVYIERVTSGDGAHYLLPHEKRSILQADSILRESSRSGEALEPVEGSKILRLKNVAPLIGAQAVSYASKEESRVTLGSRVTLIEGGDRLVVDIVGYPELYPSNDDIDEPLKLSHRSPLARLIIGETASRNMLRARDIAEDVVVKKVDQLSLQGQYPLESVMSITFEN